MKDLSLSSTKCMKHYVKACKWLTKCRFVLNIEVVVYFDVYNQRIIQNKMEVDI